MKVAVIMSTYNGEMFLQEQIESILAQEGDFTLDLWVRDDGSNDKTVQILEKYEKQGLLKWYSGDNLRPAKSFLDLLYKCVGYDYYAFADQDDYWKKDKIRRALSCLENIENDYCLYFSNANLVKSDMSSLGRNVYKNSPKTDFYTLSCAGGCLGCTMVFSQGLAKIVQENKLPQNIIMHDFFVALLCASLDGRIIYDKEATMKYRQHNNNVIGVSYGFLSKLNNRIKAITHKEEIGISQQAREILKIYHKYVPSNNLKWLNIIANYDNNIVSRFLLSISNKTRYINTNMGLKIRLSILFGNR